MRWAVFLLLWGVAALAAEDKPALSQNTHDVLIEAQGLIKEKKSAAAIDKIKALLPSIQDKSYDAAVSYQVLGYAYSAAEDYSGAAQAFREALQRNALPAAATHDLDYNLAQILIHDGKYRDGLNYLETWLKTEPAPPQNAHALAAVGYYHAGDCKSAIPHAESLAKDTGNAGEQWLQLLAACHIQLKDYTAAARVLEQLARLFPDKNDYWLQLAAAYQQAGQDGKAVVTLELLHARGGLDEAGIENLARLYLAQQLPQRAATLLEQAMNAGHLTQNAERLNLLADSWLLAQEKAKAAEALQKLIAINADAEACFRLGQIYFDLEQWPKAAEMFREATRLPGLKESGTAYLQWGIAAVHIRDQAAAEHALSQALKDKSSREQAQWWLDKLRTAGNDEDKHAPM
ncbi:MAG TPA: tetratricopeptide repeat protein [Gammaproteobacteria bacterium]|nr:tetratricopeptide repeat protein [Gammaproteobacteria bacterium]